MLRRTVFRRTVFTRSERTEDELDYIKSVLSSNVLFQDMAAIEGRWSQRILNDLAAAFYKVEYKEGDVIFSQGDPDKDFMLILEQGECQFTIGGKGGNCFIFNQHGHAVAVCATTTTL